MGKNKLAKFDDMAGYPHVFQYPFAALQEQGFAMKGHWNEQFFHNDHPIVLELGCGKGEYTVGLGQLFPEKNFIGVDIKGARMWTGAKASLEQGMTNVAFLRTSIELIAHFFAPVPFTLPAALTPRRGVGDLDHFPGSADEEGKQTLDGNPLHAAVSADLGGRWPYPPEDRQPVYVHLYDGDDQGQPLSGAFPDG